MTCFNAGIHQVEVCIVTSNSAWTASWNYNFLDPHGISTLLAYRQKADTAWWCIRSRLYPSGGTTHALIRSQLSKANRRPGSVIRCCILLSRMTYQDSRPNHFDTTIYVNEWRVLIKEWLTRKILLGSRDQWIDQQSWDHKNQSRIPSQPVDHWSQLSSKVLVKLNLM
jgi:hypothetical protein